MTNNNRPVTPEDAQDALKSITETERAGLRQTRPPFWYGVVVAFINGGFVAAAASGATEMIAVMAAALVGATAAKRRTMGAHPKDTPKGAKSFAALAGLIVFALSLLVGAKTLRDLYGFDWAPLAGGAIMTVTVFLLFLSERRFYAAQTIKEQYK